MRQRGEEQAGRADLGLDSEVVLMQIRKDVGQLFACFRPAADLRQLELWMLEEQPGQFGAGIASNADNPHVHWAPITERKL